MRTMCLGAVMLAVAGCLQEPPAPVTPVGPPAASKVPAPAPVAARPVVAAPPPPAPPPPVDLLAPEVAYSRLHGFNERVLEAARLAKTNASGASVKSYAAEVVKGHEKADAELAAVGKTLKLEAKPYPSFTLPEDEKKAEDAERARFDALKGLQGPDFDAAFLTAMGEGERREIGFLQTLGSKSLVAELKALAPKLEKVESAGEKTAEADLKKLPKKHG